MRKKSTSKATATIKEATTKATEAEKETVEKTIAKAPEVIDEAINDGYIERITQNTDEVLF